VPKTAERSIPGDQRGLSVLKKIVLLLMLSFRSVGVHADDFVQTFNTYYRDTVKLSQQNGQWVLEDLNTVNTRSAEIKILDIKNYYIKFVLVFNPDIDSDGGPVEYSFATYPRDGRSDMVAVSTWGYFGFYEPVPGERKEITANVLPSGVFLKFFDENYLAQYLDDMPVDSKGMVNRQSEVEGPDVFHYLLTIPQIGTKTLLSIDGEISSSYPQTANDLLAAVRFHHIELSWDKKQGVFKITRLY